MSGTPEASRCGRREAQQGYQIDSSDVSRYRKMTDCWRSVAVFPEGGSSESIHPGTWLRLKHPTQQRTVSQNQSGKMNLDSLDADVKLGNLLNGPWSLLTRVVEM